MVDWNSEQYLKFKQQRTQPAADLAARIKRYRPKTMVDIGCGPGNSTAVLKEVFPDTDILGIDSSQNMIQKARAAYPDLRFELCGARDLEGSYDLLFSNACLQWIEDHRRLLPELMKKLNPGGVLAVQIPINGEEPLFRIISEIAAESRWNFKDVFFETNTALTPEEYFDILSGCSAEFDLWETVYYHPMPSHQSLIEWIKATRLRPYLDALSEEDGLLFQQEIKKRAQKIYPIKQNGEILFRFRRLFFTAVRGL